NWRTSANDESIVIDFLNKWMEYFQGAFGEWLFTKYLFEIITEDEYYTYQNLRFEMVERIEKSLHFLSTLDEKLADITRLYSSEESYVKSEFIKKTSGVLRSLTKDRSSTGNEGYVMAKNRYGKRVAI